MFLAKVTPFLNLKIANYYIAHPNLKRDSPIINYSIWGGIIFGWVDIFKFGYYHYWAIGT